MKVIIVGGVAGGATAAARIRRLDEGASITIYERSGYISYANCGLPYYVGDEILDENELTLQTPLSFNKRYNIDVRVKHEVVCINTLEKRVLVKNLTTGEEFIDTYDKLLLSPGAKPITLDFLDKPLKNVYTLRTVEDTFEIKKYLNFSRPKNVCIIGGGFIGVEMAENIKGLGIDVTIIQKGDQLLKNFDKDMISFIHNHIRSKGVKILLNSNVVGLENIDDELIVNFSDNSSLKFDVVLVAIGVRPDNELAIKAGLKLGDSGAISVNSMMETSISDIYAVGDAVEITHNVLGEKRIITLAGPANKEARVAASNICGMESSYQGSIAPSIIKVFDISAASVGINEEEAKRNNIKYEKIILSPLNHASYYPNAKPMTLKVLYDKKDNSILGAQCVGYEGVDKRIDVIATSIFSNLKVYMLKDLDLVYAPPYSSAKDPVNVAGYIADNIICGLVKQFYYEDIDMLRNRDDVILLDTRTVNEYIKGHAESFINIPLDDLRNKLNILDKNKKIYVMCQSGLRSYLAVRILMENNFDAYNFVGGYKLYSSIEKDRISN